jgi:hypothetical protein
VRFYDLAVTEPNGGSTTLHFSSYPNGSYDPGALNVIFDLYVYPQALPMGGSTVLIEGVDPALLGNAKNYAGQTVAVRGGMGAGLPLANPAQIGLLVQGEIYQVFANWIGTQINLAMVLIASPYTLQNPGNIQLNWIAGTTLATALTNTLKTAYPSATIQMNIGDIVLSHDEKHAASTLSGLARLVNEITPTGVQIVINGSWIRVFDSTYRPTPKVLAFTDFIGQPMWIEPAVIQARVVLRGDIQVGDIIQMPQGYANLPGFVQTTANAMPSQLNYKSAIQGQFSVLSIRHIGNLRQANGNAWATVINAAALSVTTTP